MMEQRSQMLRQMRLSKSDREKEVIVGRGAASRAGQNGLYFNITV